MQKKLITLYLVVTLFCVSFNECRTFSRENLLKYHADLFPKAKFDDFIDVLKFLSKRNQFSRMLKILNMLDVKELNYRANIDESENVQEEENKFFSPEDSEFFLNQKRRTFFVGK